MATGEQILIVESDPDIADLIARQSLQPLGYQVTVLSDPASALKRAVQTPPQLIIANLNLPGLSGKDLITALTSHGVQSPLIIIAEKGQEADAIQAFRLGASDVIFWPVHDTEVVSIVERALRQTREKRERVKLDLQLRSAAEEQQKRLRDLTTIVNTVKAVVSITDQRVLFDRILESVLQLAEADMCWLLLRDERSNSYLLRSHLNLPEAWAKKTNQPLDDGISSLVAQSGQSLLINGSPLQKFKIAALGKAAAVIPIKIQNEVIGLIVVVRKKDREMTRDAQTLLEAMADYASISLVNARLFRALEQTSENARMGEKHRQAALESMREAIHGELQAAGYPLNLVMTEMPGALNLEQKKALQSVQEALSRLSRSSEKTVVPTSAKIKS
jgi:DNA-binding response OmpR family regulator